MASGTSTELTNINAGLFLFYVALLGNYTGELIPPSLQRFINNNRYIQHIIAFIILLFTINLYSTLSTGKVILFTFLLWLWFLFTSKQYLYPILTIIVLLIISYAFYLLDNKLDAETDITKEVKNSRKRIYVKIQKTCFILIIIVSLVGGYFYFVDHYHQYRSKSKTFLEFLFKYFLLGKGKTK